MRIQLVLLPLALLLLPAAGAGELSKKTLRSEALGRQVDLAVLLPDGYATEKDRRYPVVYLLHGFGGDYLEWTRVGVAEEAAGLPVIIAMPEGDRSFYMNHHGDPQGRWEDYLTHEVVKFMDETFRTIARREGRAISGLSMGGYGAMVLGLRHPELFSSVASHSGALGVPGALRTGEVGERLARIFGPDDSEERKRYDLKNIAAGLPKEHRPDVYIDCGSSDFLLEHSRGLVAELSRLGYAYEYRETPGAHNFEYWKRNVRYSLEHQLKVLGQLEVASAARPASAPAAAAAPAPGAAAPAKAPPPGNTGFLGDWALSVDIQGQRREYTLRFSEKEKKLSAVVISARSGEHPCRSVAVKDGAVRFEVEREIVGTPVTFLYEGKLDGQTLSGSLTPMGHEEFRGTWTARRKPRGEEL